MSDSWKYVSPIFVRLIMVYLSQIYRESMVNVWWMYCGQVPDANSWRIKLMKHMEFDLKWIHMGRYALILRLDGAQCLRIISGPLLTPKVGSRDAAGRGPNVCLGPFRRLYTYTGKASWSWRQGKGKKFSPKREKGKRRTIDVYPRLTRHDMKLAASTLQLLWETVSDACCYYLS